MTIMEQREKLIDLISPFTLMQNAFFPTMAAGYLIKHGVVVLPCRCCECEHYSGDSEYGVCHHWQYYCDAPEVNGDDFCSYAKRKVGDK